MNVGVERTRFASPHFDSSGHARLAGVSYTDTVEQPESLRSILFRRKNEIRLEEAAEWSEAHRLAARSQGLGDPEKLLHRLKKTGRIN